MRHLLILLSAVAAICSPSAAQAPDDAAQRAADLAHDRQEAGVKARRPNMTVEFAAFSAPSGGMIEANGIITDDTYDAFFKLIEKVESEDNNVSYVSFNSEGGNLGAAIRIGELLRRKNIATAVGYADQCVSACAIAFLGGEIRSISPRDSWAEGKASEQDSLGFHSFSFARKLGSALAPAEAEEFAQGIAQDTQTTVGDLARYIAAMGADPQIIQLSAPYGPERFLFPPVGQLEALRIVSVEEDGGDFRLIPDRGGTVAIYMEEDRQLLLGCDVEGTKAEAVIVMGTPIRKSRAERAPKWTEPVKLSAILSAPQQFWQAEDREHKHFHAGGLLTITDSNPVFGLVEIWPDKDRDEPVTIEMDDRNSRFYATADAFYAVVTMPKSVARDVAGAETASVVFGEDSALPSDFRYHFHNGDQDRENIAFALQRCLALPGA